MQDLPVPGIAPEFFDRRGDFHGLEHLEQGPVIQRQRRFTFGKTAKRNQTDQIVRPAGQTTTAFDELAENFLDGLQSVHVIAVDFEVHGLHRTGSVDTHLDCDAFGAHVKLVQASLGPRQCDNEQRHANQPHPRQHAFDPLHHGYRQTFQELHTRVQHSGLSPAPDRQQADRQKRCPQEQPKRILEAKST